MNVVVTGANRGIGLALVRGWLAKGASVVATARDVAKATELRALADTSGGKLEVLALDVSSDASCKAFGSAMTDRKIDVLINNAGIYGERSEKLEALSFDDMVHVFNTNTLGPLRVMQALAPALVKGAKTLHVTSLMGSIDDNTSGGSYGYRLSKAALNMAGKNLALELAGKKIVVLLVHPGWVQTDMGGRSAPVTPNDSATGIITLAEKSTMDDTGKFFTYDGRPLAW